MTVPNPFPDPGEAAVTAIIPTFRRPEMLSRAIESVQNQQGVDLRIHILDNASEDQTASIVARLAHDDPRIYYHCHDTNIGMLANFDFGLRTVRTRYVSILSDDDVLLAGCYKLALDGFRDHPDAAISGGTTVMVRSPEEIVASSILKWPEARLDPPAGAMRMISHRFPIWTGLLLSTHAIEKAGFLSDEVQIAFDLDLLFRISLRFPIVMDERPSAICFIHPQSASFDPDPQQLHTVRSSLSRAVDPLPLDLDQQISREVLKALHLSLKRMMTGLALKNIRLGHSTEAKQAIEALREHPGTGTRRTILRLGGALAGRIPNAMGRASSLWEIWRKVRDHRVIEVYEGTRTIRSVLAGFTRPQSRGSTKE